MTRRTLEPFLELVLGPAGQQRLRVSQTLLGLVIYIAYAGLQAVEVAFGLIDRAESDLLAATYVGGGLLFYALVRSGLSRYLGSDPGLPRPQMVFGLTCAVWAYAISEPTRGAALTVPMMVIVFGMFSLRAREVRAMALFTLATLSLVMLWRTRGPQARYGVEQELVHFLFAAILLAGVGVLSVQMGRLRSNLGRQKRELERALEQIRMLATRDELTGLVNRRHMSVLLHEEQERQTRSGRTMTLVLIDIDLFKRINDSHGHAAGDTVLRRFADAASTVVRNTDAVSRWGGEEFLLMLPGTGADEAKSGVDRIRESLGRVVFDDIAERLTVTFSAGLAECPPNASIDAAIDRADRAMYRAKASGRNCTMAA